MVQRSASAPPYLERFPLESLPGSLEARSRGDTMSTDGGSMDFTRMQPLNVDDVADTDDVLMEAAIGVQGEPVRVVNETAGVAAARKGNTANICSVQSPASMRGLRRCWSARLFRPLRAAMYLVFD